MNDRDVLTVIGKLAERLAKTEDEPTRAVAAVVFAALGAHAAGEAVGLRNLVITGHTAPMLARIGNFNASGTGSVQ